VPDVGENSPDPSRSDTGSSLDKALREAVEMIDSPEYQNGNPAFSLLTTRDWVIMAAVYVLIPVAFALVVGLP
jgi:hypothetical protein